MRFSLVVCCAISDLVMMRFEPLWRVSDGCVLFWYSRSYRSWPVYYTPLGIMQQHHTTRRISHNTAIIRKTPFGKYLLSQLARFYLSLHYQLYQPLVALHIIIIIKLQYGPVSLPCFDFLSLSFYPTSVSSDQIRSKKRYYAMSGGSNWVYPPFPWLRLFVRLVCNIDPPLTGVLS